MTLDELIARIRPHIVEIGDCWEWEGALQSCGTTPVMRALVDQPIPLRPVWRTVSLRRLIHDAKGVKLGKRLATYTCTNERCVNPEHVGPITRTALQQRTAKATNYAMGPLRRARLAEVARAHAKLTMDLAQEIKAAPGTQRERAERYGVSQSAISNIDRGEAWRDYTNPFAQLMR